MYVVSEFSLTENDVDVLTGGRWTTHYMYVLAKGPDGGIKIKMTIYKLPDSYTEWLLQVS